MDLCAVLRGWERFEVLSISRAKVLPLREAAKFLGLRLVPSTRFHPLDYGTHVIHRIKSR